MSSEEEFLNEEEKRFLKKHWRMIFPMIILAVIAVVVAIFVFTWFVELAQTTDLVPDTIGLWSVGHVITFILHLLFWELLLVGSWVLVVFLIILIRWYMKLPEEDREGWPKRGRREESDAFGFLVGITWLIVVWLDGRWNLEFQAWTFDDWVYSFLAALTWDLI
ncbi:MAG: hypothetical protein ACFFE3_08940, partial [Candidatus Thorarchaeota archaeon]